jgi:DNA-directed RNA polymerase subunit beta
MAAATDGDATLTPNAIASRRPAGPVEVILLAAANNATTTPKSGRNAHRLSFATIKDTLEVPDLLSLQTESFDWLVGNEGWIARRDYEIDNGGNDVPRTSGLDEIFDEISPIEDNAEQMQLTFREPTLEPAKYSIDECKERGKTYSAPLYVTAEFMRYETGEIKTQTVFMGDFPLMTDKGTFIINGTERVVVSQLVRSPGVYFERTPEKNSDIDVYSSRVIPSRGAWLEFEVDKKGLVAVRIDRKRKQSVTVFLRAIGMSEEEIRAEFAGYETLLDTLSKDDPKIQTQEDALRDIYKKLRPGEQVASEAAKALLENYYFNDKRYDLAKVGRYKINRKLGLEAPISDSVLSVEDIVATIKYLVALQKGEATIEGTRGGGEIVDIPLDVDDIDHFGNRRIRAVGELIQNQVRTGLSRMERVVRERMTTQEIDSITPQSLINVRPVVAAIKEFFGTSQLSQFMDQNNPLAGITHKRRLNALGPGGLSRERAGVEVRDVHASHYGRMCPIETPEGPNIGLIGSLATFARINAFGFIETPYRRVNNGVVTSTSSRRRTRRSTRTAATSKTTSSCVRRVARLSSCPPTRSTTWTSRRARWCRWVPRSSRSSSTTTRTARSWARTCSARLCRCCVRARRSSAPVWRATPRSTPVTSSRPSTPVSSPRCRPTRWSCRPMRAAASRTGSASSSARTRAPATTTASS